MVVKSGQADAIEITDAMINAGATILVQSGHLIEPPSICGVRLLVREILSACLSRAKLSENPAGRS